MALAPFAAVAGRFVAQTPNALLTEQIGWRGVEWILFSTSVAVLVVLIVLWIMEHCHNKKQRAENNKRTPSLNTARESSSDHGAQRAPNDSGEMAIATAYRKPGHVKVVNVMQSLCHGTNLTNSSTTPPRTCQHSPSPSLPLFTPLTIALTPTLYPSPSPSPTPSFPQFARFARPYPRPHFHSSSLSLTLIFTATPPPPLPPPRPQHSSVPK